VAPPGSRFPSRIVTPSSLIRLTNSAAVKVCSLPHPATEPEIMRAVTIEMARPQTTPRRLAYSSGDVQAVSDLRDDLGRGRRRHQVLGGVQEYGLDDAPAAADADRRIAHNRSACLRRPSLTR
jgi:hypothetical protein